MSKRFWLLLATLALLAGVLALIRLPGTASAAARGELVLRFAASKDFGGVPGKVLYVRQDLPDWMPLRCLPDRLEGVAGFVPAGKAVTVLQAGLRLGSAVAGTGPLSVPVSSPPAGAVVAVVESERELPTLRWVSHGVPEWSPGRTAAVVSGFGNVGGRQALLVKEPNDWTDWGGGHALAFFDGTGWSRAPGVLALSVNYFLASSVVVGTEFWVAAGANNYGTAVYSTPDGGATWGYAHTGGKYGRRLLAAFGNVLFDDTDGAWPTTNRLYSWDHARSQWVDAGPSLVRTEPNQIIPYARQGDRLYAASDGFVKEYVPGAWGNVCSLPPGMFAGLLTVCRDGTLWIADGTGSTWYRRPGASQWVNCGKPLGLAPAVLVAMPDDSVWAAVNVGNNTWAVARWNGSGWMDMGHPVQGAGTSINLFPGVEGSLYVVARGYYKYNYPGQGLYELPCALEP